MSRKPVIFKFYDTIFPSNNFLTQHKVKRTIYFTRTALWFTEITPRRALTLQIITLDIPSWSFAEQITLTHLLFICNDMDK